MEMLKMPRQRTSEEIAKEVLDKCMEGCPERWPIWEPIAKALTALAEEKDAELGKEMDRAVRMYEDELKSNDVVIAQMAADNVKLDKENKELREALSGRTVSCSQCNKAGEEISALRKENERLKEDVKQSILARLSRFPFLKLREGLEKHDEIVSQGGGYCGVKPKYSQDELQEIRKQLLTTLPVKEKCPYQHLPDRVCNKCGEYEPVKGKEIK
jgi:ribosomal protein L32